MTSRRGAFFQCGSLETADRPKSTHRSKLLAAALLPAARRWRRPKRAGKTADTQHDVHPHGGMGFGLKEE